MARLAIVVLALLLGGAAPARAWCEAACLAPAEASGPAHCPTPDTPSADPSISATAIADCPVIETSRPVPARLDLELSDRIVVVLSPSAPARLRPPAATHLRPAALQRLTPLRI